MRPSLGRNKSGASALRVDTGRPSSSQSHRSHDSGSASGMNTGRASTLWVGSSTPRSTVMAALDSGAMLTSEQLGKAVAAGLMSLEHALQMASEDPAFSSAAGGRRSVRAGNALFAVRPKDFTKPAPSTPGSQAKGLKASSASPRVDAASGQGSEPAKPKHAVTDVQQTLADLLKDAAELEYIPLSQAELAERRKIHVQMKHLRTQHGGPGSKDT
jgi:hypothetical protein